MNIKSINQNLRIATQKHEVNSRAGLPEEYITKDEVARRLKKTARTIEIWQRKGFIPFMKLGTAVFYRWSDIVAHMHRNFRVCRLTRRKVKSRNGATKDTRLLRRDFPEPKDLSDAMASGATKKQEQQQQDETKEEI